MYHFFLVLSYQLVILTAPILAVIGQLKKIRHCENFFLLQHKNSLKVTLKVFPYEIVGHFHSFCLPLKRITNDFKKMEVSNYS